MSAIAREDFILQCAKYLCLQHHQIWNRISEKQRIIHITNATNIAAMMERVAYKVVWEGPATSNIGRYKETL